MPTTPTGEDYEGAAVKLLSILVKLTGWTRRRLDEHLGYSVGYMSRLLTGNTKLLYRHIVEILEAIEVEPARYFEVLHPGSSPQHLLDLLEKARRIGAGVEVDPALLPVEERIRLAVETFKFSLGRPTVRGRSPRPPETDAS